jgi:hypothetical protein
LSASLEGLRALSTYQRLLQIADANGIDATLRVVRDGAGDASALSLSTTSVGVPLRPGGLSADLAEYLARGRRDATVYGVDNTGATNATAQLKAVLEMGGSWYFPEGTYWIARAGVNAGGVFVTLTKDLDVVCHPNARFIAGAPGAPLDNDMFSINAPTNGVGLPAGGIKFSWIGGYFDQTNQCVSTSVPFLAEYPAPSGLAGASATCDALSLRLSYTVDSVGYNAARSTYVGDAVFYAGAHWETAGGDSGIFMGGGSGQGRVERCMFYGSRDLGIYSSGVASGRQGLTVNDCYFESCFGGFSAKRGQNGYFLTGNTFRNCIVAMASSPLTRASENGYVSGNVLIGNGIGFRASASDDNWFVGNLFLSIGALRADGTTSVTPYGFSALYWLSGSSGNTVSDAHCYVRTTGSTGDRYGVLMRDNNAFLCNKNRITNIITDNFRYCVANEGTGTGNYIEACYNYNASINDPLPGADFLIRMDEATQAPIFRSAPRFANGSAATPIISRETQTNTGIFFGTSEIGFSANGVERLDVTSTQISASVPVRLPNYTTTQRNALASPQVGWIIFNTTTGAVETYNGTAWV